MRQAAQYGGGNASSPTPVWPYTRRQNHMRHPRFTCGRAFWMVCVCLLLLPRVAAAAAADDPGLPIDFDRDGQRDNVVRDPQRPSVLQVWLSASGKTHIIHTRVPLLQVIVRDFDGDHRPELIASDSKLQIHVWTRKAKGFRPYRPRHVVPDRLEQPHRPGVDDSDREPVDLITSTTFALTLCASPRAPALEPTQEHACRTAPACGSFTAVDPFAPRPPPTPHFSL